MPRRAVSLIILAALMSGCTDTPRGGSPPVVTERGGQLFKERCAPCHPNGGNVLTPGKTLHAGVLADHGITTPADIVKKMRNPGPGMVRFDETTIPDADARLIADYVLATFR
ncbi:cytochrome C [Geomonas terrae]|uniref:Cytochrome C n=1 Tax=Geomonas terrae TaxID=2562681 RepID=A0A4S1CKN1_9BACT|nr:c-type cytochrome [Geomonas terrae]TGU74265.1 cytochrome C [Geomonas terrae]